MSLDFEISEQVDRWTVQCSELISAHDLCEHGEQAEIEGRVAEAARAYVAACQVIPQFGPALIRLGRVENALDALQQLQRQLTLRRPDMLALLRAVEILEAYQTSAASNSGELVEPLRQAQTRLDRLAALRLDEARRLIEQADNATGLSSRIHLLSAAKQLVNEHEMSLVPEGEASITVADRLSVSLAQANDISALFSRFSGQRDDFSFGLGEFAGAVTLLNSVASPLTLLTDTVVFRRDLVSYACNMCVRKLTAETGVNSANLHEADAWYQAGASAMHPGAPLPPDLMGQGRRISNLRRLDNSRTISELAYRLASIGGLLGLAFYGLATLVASQIAR